MSLNKLGISKHLRWGLGGGEVAGVVLLALCLWVASASHRDAGQPVVNPASPATML